MHLEVLGAIGWHDASVFLVVGNLVQFCACVPPQYCATEVETDRLFVHETPQRALHTNSYRKLSMTTSDEPPPPRQNVPAF